jgi:hypothetical protein
MKHQKVLIWLLLVIFCSVPVSSQSTFEGVVESANTTTDETGAAQHFTMTMWVKGGMVRVGISAYGSNPVTTVIYRRDRGLVWMLNDRDRTYFEIRRQEGPPGEKGRVSHPSEIRPTGKKRTILGYACDQLLLKEGETETEYWATKKLGALAGAIGRAFDVNGNEPGAREDDELTRMGYFPLVVRTTLGGKIVESSEVTKVSLRSVEGGLFELPSEYKKESVPDLFHGEGE